MGKVYATQYEDFRVVQVLVPTTENCKGLFEELMELAEEVGYIKFVAESKKPPRFMGTTYDVMKITFVSVNCMNSFMTAIRKYAA